MRGRVKVVLLSNLPNLGERDNEYFVGLFVNADPDYVRSII